MPSIHVRKGWAIAERDLTPESVYVNRREILKGLGFTGLGLAALMAGCGTDKVDAQGELVWKPTGVPSNNPNAALYPAKRNPKYVLDRPLTAEKPTATYNNYYEFTTDKGGVWKLAEGFQARTRPWHVEVTGLVEHPGKFSIDDLVKEFGVEERTYRHRCVEAWAMAVPWTGFPFSKLLAKVQPKSEATHVRTVTYLDKEHAPGQKSQPWYPWPYFEGLRMDEAMNELTFVATGIYGHELPAQNGAPWRLTTPWKYGYKSIKAIVKIELVNKQPATFWNQVAPLEYSFLSNVDPTKPHPRWSQAHEKLIDTGETVPTQPFNGYGDFVAKMYA
ncbi:MAG: protein-methionine-sulfoxide reductase catalytic subunit MsrP [bacterium]